MAGHDHSHEEEFDEHVWTSPKNAKHIVEKISNALCEIDSENADIYRANTTEYIGKLDELDKNIKDVVDSSARKVLIFGDRFPLRYFVDAYGLDYYAAFSGCSIETDASAATVAFLIDKIKEKIPAVFHIELSNHEMADTISEATGAKVLEFHSVHNISKEDFENGADYIALMYKNIASLKEALN